MALTEEMKAKIAKLDPNIMAEVEDLEQNLNHVTRESLDRKNKIRAYEASQKGLVEKLKARGIDPDQDIDDQLNKVLDSAKTGMKPATEFEQLSKKFDKVMNELGSWKEQATKAQQEARMEKARAAFSSKLPDHFGPASDLILDYAVVKGLVGVNDDGLPGINHDGDFIPLNNDKGKTAIDVLKGMYPQFAQVKQKAGTGTGGGSTQTSSSTGRVISFTEFESMPHAEKQAFMASVSKGEASIE